MTIPQFTAGQVLTAAELNAMVDAINAGGGKMEVQQFTATGTFTVPAGVTHVVAHIRAGGGGVGTAASGTGGTSSVAFAGGTISATGGVGMNSGSNSGMTNNSYAAPVNSGEGAASNIFRNGTDDIFMFGKAPNGAEIVAGGATTPAATIAITVGAPGVAGTSGAAGGSGYVWLEYTV